MAKVYQVQVSQVIPRLESVKVIGKPISIKENRVSKDIPIGQTNEKIKNMGRYLDSKNGNQLTKLPSGDSFIYPPPVNNNSNINFNNGRNINNNNQSVVSTAQVDRPLQHATLSHGLQHNMAFSPPSPLSMMDLMTVGQLNINCMIDSFHYLVYG